MLNTATAEPTIDSHTNPEIESHLRQLDIECRVVHDISRNWCPARPWMSARMNITTGLIEHTQVYMDLPIFEPSKNQNYSPRRLARMEGFFLVVGESLRVWIEQRMEGTSHISRLPTLLELGNKIHEIAKLWNETQAIALPSQDDDGYPETQPETQPEPQPDHQPEREPHRQTLPVPANLAKTIPASKYSQLTHAAQSVLIFLDSFSPDPDAVAWPCDYDLLMKMATESTAISETQLIPTLGTLQHLQIIDFAVALDGDRLQLWVSAHQHRARLRHEMVTQLIATRRALVDRVADQVASQPSSQPNSEQTAAA